MTNAALIARFRAMLPANVAREARVFLLGCGGIGSYTGSLLARMGVGNFMLIDNDNVEEPNVGTQDYTPIDVGTPKVDALRDRIRALNFEARIESVNTRIERKVDMLAQLKAYGPTVAIAAVDNIEARRLMWACIAGIKAPIWYIDPRMGAEAFEMHVLQRGCKYQAEYEAFLKDETYAEEPCGATAIAYTGAFAGAMVASTVRQALLNTARTGCVYSDTGAFAMRNTFKVEKRTVNRAEARA